MARLMIERLTKLFGPHKALDAVDLQVADGEFVAVLGPSGCGKTTLLRLVAGFDQADGGTIAIGERIVSSDREHVPPEDRKIGIVFQSYALWPHLTVAENVGYGLKVAKVRAPERTRRVADALALVGLSQMGERRPANLSGGQRQRVALARCLVTEPSLVLLDEPLANLDVHLRAAMEDEFADFHRRTGTTMFYITHDQAEAMALADRIAVMDKGVLMQIATPSQLYREPATRMVAGFIGDGLVLPAEVGSAAEGRAMVRLLGHDLEARCRPDQAIAPDAAVCLRPRDLRLTQGDGIPARVTRAIYQGGFFRIEVRPESAPDQILVVHQDETAPVSPGEAVTIAARDAWVIPE